MAETAIIELKGEALPPDCIVTRYRAHESVSRPYEVSIEINVPLDQTLDEEACLRTSMLLTLHDFDGRTRFFHGVVDQASYVTFTGQSHQYELRLRPALAALAHREDCRIWQHTNVIDIAKELFEEAGFGDAVEYVLHETHDSHEYTVQYRESALNFVHRLFEDEGIFYFFRHTPDGHQMVVADAVAAFVDGDDAPTVAFAMSQGFGGDPLDDIRRTRRLRPSKALLRDYDFVKPEVKPEAEQTADDKLPTQVYRYPGGFTKSGEGKLKANALLRARRRDSDVAVGQSQAIGLRVGAPFSIAGAAQPWLNARFVVVDLETFGEQSEETSDEDNDICRNRFRAVPEGLAYVPQRLARRPRIRGVQTAVVTGPSSDAEAIHVDEYGRIKVRFFWDRINQQDDTSSCWLRVAQLATGGTMLLPRVGWEMFVAFVDGDPDRPFALGRVYNGEKVPPAALPGAKASGGLKSYSTPGGAGINELNLGDAGGAMGWTLNAQKDLNVVIGNDKIETIDVDSSHDVKVNTTNSVGANETIVVGGDQSETTGAARTTSVGGSQTIKVGGSETNNATHNMLETVTGDREYKVGGNMTVISNTVMQTVTGNVSRTVGAVQLTGSIVSITDDIGGDFSETVGLAKIDLAWGTASETVNGNKDATSAAAELHLVDGNYNAEGSGSVTCMTGGVHYRKIDGDYSVKAPLVTLLGATGDFKGGKGNIKLGGGPVVAKGSKIAAKATGINVKLGASLKMG
jgi:type VI secretion system secreted protein VgrG